MSGRTCFRLGSAAVALGGVGHFLMIDLGTLWFRTGIARFEPQAHLVELMRGTTLTFDALGKTNPFHAWAGMSLMMSVSLCLFGALFWSLSREPVKLRPFRRLALALCAAFSAVAAFCFIWPAATGGVLAALLFATSERRGES